MERSTEVAPSQPALSDPFRLGAGGPKYERKIVRERDARHRFTLPER